MDDKLLKDLVIHSAKEVFDKMVSMQVRPERPDDVSLFDGHIHLCATIGFAGQWNGSISLQCGEDLAYQLTSKMLCMDTSSVGKEDVWDALGEIVNMVGGKFKAIFAENFNDGVEAFKMSVPSVIMGKNYRLFVVGSDSIPLTVSQLADGKGFSMKLVLRKTEK
jgi:chemotaxis protein CheX